MCSPIFKQITEFYEAIKDDARIGTSHISLYMALLQQWNLNGRINPVTIERVSIMRAAKISSRCTYNKCINALNEYGYINYSPSSDPLRRSTVYLKGL